jgi:hypothetical protein
MRSLGDIFFMVSIFARRIRLEFSKETAIRLEQLYYHLFTCTILITNKGLWPIQKGRKAVSYAHTWAVDDPLEE